MKVLKNRKIILIVTALIQITVIICLIINITNIIQADKQNEYKVNLTATAIDTTIAEDTKNNADNAEITKLNELQQKYSQLLTESNKKAVDDIKAEITQFMNEYKEAININFFNLRMSYSEKQAYIKNRVYPFFVDSQWIQTEYYERINMPETFTNGNGISEYTVMPNFVREITKVYYKNITADSADVFVVIDNKTKKCTDCEKLTIRKENSNWKITDYQLIRGN